jgi:O-antigen/teichoic acid export membrane protein
MRERPGSLRRLFWGTVAGLLALGAVPATALGLWGPELFSLVFGQDWHPAGVYAQQLAFLFLGLITVTPLAHILNLADRQYLQLAWEIARLSVMAVTLWWMPRAGAPVELAVGRFGVAMAMAYAGLLVLYAIAARKISR